MVYGTFNSKYFRSLILANPDIEDPDWVDVDQEVSLPAIPVTVGTTDRNISWIVVDEKDDLNSAFDFLRNYPANAPPARLIPYWNQKSGTRFAIILKRHFFDADTALEQLSRMPAELAPKGKVLSGWRQDTVFFADPFTRSSSALSVRAQGE
jgi:general secretion pathway protein A